MFAAFAWVKAPDIFDNYIIVSPSLWYAERRPLRDLEQACSSNPFAQGTDLFMAVGDHEEQPSQDRLMVTDLKRMKSVLDGCATRKASTYLRIFEDETHASVFPAALSTGLRKHFQ